MTAHIKMVGVCARPKCGRKILPSEVVEFQQGRAHAALPAPTVCAKSRAILNARYRVNSLNGFTVRMSAVSGLKARTVYLRGAVYSLPTNCSLVTKYTSPLPSNVCERTRDRKNCI